MTNSWSALCCLCAVERSICSLPRAAGSCSSWVSRYHFDVISSKCVHFWYGGCHGNSNNFMTLAECKRTCPRPAPSWQAPQPAAPSGESTRTAAGEHSTTGAETSAGRGSTTDGQSRNMGRIFIVQRGSTSSTSRQATSAATNAHRGRVYLRVRRPSHGTAAQHTGPAAR